MQLTRKEREELEKLPVNKRFDKIHDKIEELYMWNRMRIEQLENAKRDIRDKISTLNILIALIWIVEIWIIVYLYLF